MSGREVGYLGAMTQGGRGWDVLLIGGASGVGKTRLAFALSDHFAVSVLQVDDLQVAFESLTTAEQQPELHFWRTNWAEFSAFSDAEFVEHFRSVARGVFHPAVEAVIAEHLESGYPLIIEGDFLLPSLAVASSFLDQPSNGRVAAIFIHEDDEQQIAANYGEREGQPQEFRAHASWLNAQWLRGECGRLTVPSLPSRPWDTLATRTIAAIAKP